MDCLIRSLGVSAYNAWTWNHAAQLLLHASSSCTSEASRSFFSVDSVCFLCFRLLAENALWQGSTCSSCIGSTSSGFSKMHANQ